MRSGTIVFVARRLGSASVALVLLVLVLLGLAVVAVVWLPAKTDGAGQQSRPAMAKVVESAPCGTSTRGDLVEVTVGGNPRKAHFDGCGHERGQRLPVRVPASPGRNFQVHPADSDVVSVFGGSGLRGRVGWVLLTLAGVAGGGYTLMLRGDRSSHL